jgi:type IV pilus assembly protein PilM
VIQRKWVRLCSLASKDTFRESVSKVGVVQRFTRWLDAMPRPPIAIEIAWDRISAVRWSRAGSVEEFAVEAIPAGAIAPSAVETNIADAAAVRSAMSTVCSRIHASDEDATLLLPDPVVRVFVQHFDEFPRLPQEAVPMLRWKLKKSVPFDMADTVLSYVRQVAQENGVDVVTAIARLRVVREYEELLESAGVRAGVVSSSSLAALALLEDSHSILLARISDQALTTAIVRDGVLCGFRCTELPARGVELTPKILLDEIYPIAAYYQDSWHATIESVCVSGIASRFREFVQPMESEFHCKVRPLLDTAAAGGRVPESARPLADNGLDGLVGCMLSRV